MSGFVPRSALVLLLGSTLWGSAAADAATSPSSSKSSSSVSYRWVDEQGVVHYGDRVPPQYAQKEQTLLNSQGVEVKRLQAQKSPEQIAEEQREHDALLRQKQHDSFLMTTYTSVEDIEALRDVRLDQLHGQRIAAEQYVENLHSRLSALQSRARNFRPYSARVDSRRMPDDLAEDLVHTLNELHTQSDVLTAKGEEERNLKSQFQADIERYQELHPSSAAR